MVKRRTFDSFDDEILVRTVFTEEPDGRVIWTSTLDAGLITYTSDPNFAAAGRAADKAASIKGCADRIRENARGIGPLAPYSALAEGFDLRYRLMPHWRKKELLRDLGIDPNEAVQRALHTLEEDPWRMPINWQDSHNITPHIEFAFEVHSEVQAERVARGAISRTEGVEATIFCMKDEFARHGRGALTADVLERMMNRIEERIPNPDLMHEECFP